MNLLKEAINKKIFQIIFMKPGFWVVKTLTDNNENSDNDDNHS